MRVSQWGNSLAVRLPKRLVEQMNLKPGDELEIVAGEGRRLEVSRDDRRQRALASMAARQWKLPEGYKFDREEANRR